MITYVIPIISDVYIGRYLYTLYKFSPKDSFKVILIDQCEDRVRPEVWEYIKDKVHLYIHPSRNMGYAKAMNEGIIHGLHWKSDYICISNDDIEIINKRWLQGIFDTFARDEERTLGVVPMSPRVAGWGYGVAYNPEVLPYKEEYTDEDYQYLLDGDFSNVTWELPKTFPRKSKGMVVDGAAFIMVYFKREAFEKVGLLDEKFFPGSGEDYDWLCRAYSQNYRVVSTSFSWVWHHWSKSKDLFASGQLERPYYKNRSYFADWESLYPLDQNNGHKADVWGHYTEDGKKIPLKRIEEIFVDQV